MNKQGMELKAYLKEKRTAADKSQWDVAREMDYGSAQFVSNWERGVSSPPIGKLKKLAEILETDADELFSVFLNQVIRETTQQMRKKFFGKSR